MLCPQCGAETPDEEWNCISCRMNVYWASQHYRDLAGIRQRQGLRAAADTPPFLLRVHESAMTERADLGGKVEHKVRQIARRAMRREAPDPAGIPALARGVSRAGVEPAGKPPDIEPPQLAGSRMQRPPEEAT